MIRKVLNAKLQKTFFRASECLVSQCRPGGARSHHPLQIDSVFQVSARLRN